MRAIFMRLAQYGRGAIVCHQTRAALPLWAVPPRAVQGTLTLAYGTLDSEGPPRQRRKWPRSAVPVVFLFSCSGVFLVLLASFGSGRCLVRFVFAWGSGVGSVSVRCPSRSAVARLLWRFRAARRWVRSPSSGVALSLRSGVVASSLLSSLGVPFCGLRWLACRPVFVSVRCPALSSRRRVPVSWGSGSFLVPSLRFFCFEPLGFPSFASRCGLRFLFARPGC